MSEDLRHLFLQGVPFIDLRAEVEFSCGHIPGAINLPILNTLERAEVGTVYKREGQANAIARAKEVVGEEMLHRRAAGWSEFLRQNPQAHLYCFRGGLRSQFAQEALRRYGVDAPVVSGGYKRLRRYLLSVFADNRLAQAPSLVVSGFTGSGKTEMLRRWHPSIPLCDLESVAAHRGSAFGKLPQAQPTQIDFENRLAVVILCLLQSPDAKMVFEDESSRIGAREIPGLLFSKLQHSPLCILQADEDERIHRIANEYVLQNLKDFSDAADWDQMKGNLQLSLLGISRRLGGLRTQQAACLLEEAFTRFRQNANAQAFAPTIAFLLREYYDPLYAKHLAQNESRIIFRGPAPELKEFLLEWQIRPRPRAEYRHAIS